MYSADMWMLSQGRATVQFLFFLNSQLKKEKIKKNWRSMYDTPIKNKIKKNLNKNPLDLLTNELMLIA